MEDLIKKVLDLLYQEEGANGVTRVGCYGISRKSFYLGLKHYIDTGENVLKEHDTLTFLSYRARKGELSNEDILIFEKSLKKETFRDIFSFYNEYELNDIRYGVEKYKEEIKYTETYEYNRRLANNFLGNKKNRKEIFEKCGYKCKHCGSIEKISIDHIIPVSKGGNNHIDNFQVLCVPCNSKKSNKI